MKLNFEVFGNVAYVNSYLAVSVTDAGNTTAIQFNNNYYNNTYNSNNASYVSTFANVTVSVKSPSNSGCFLQAQQGQALQIPSVFPAIVEFKYHAGKHHPYIVSIFPLTFAFLQKLALEVFAVVPVRFLELLSPTPHLSHLLTHSPFVALLIAMLNYCLLRQQMALYLLLP